jgi:signal transduction histidine kinase
VRRPVRVPAWAVDVAAVAIAAVDVWILFWWDEFTWEHWLVVLGVAALALRRRFPLVVFVATLPSALVLGEAAAPLIALYTLSERTSRRWLLGVCAVALGIAVVTTLPFEPPTWEMDSSFLVWAAYSVGPPAAAVFLGQLVRAQRELSERLEEITDAKEHEQLLMTKKILAEEREQLAREMHDVVTHQVSLIAVRAGTLQVGTTDPKVKAEAETIRSLSVGTLDELRHMVNLVRSGGSGPGLAPQPTLDRLGELIEEAGSAIDFAMGAIPELTPPMERAIYRTVQEGLTNIRKHAPGASVRVSVVHRDGVVEVEVVNTAPTDEPVALPSSRHGLIGLRQRAEFLDGVLESGPTDAGGWRLRLRLPTGAAA